MARGVRKGRHEIYRLIKTILDKGRLVHGMIFVCERKRVMSSDLCKHGLQNKIQYLFVQKKEETIHFKSRHSERTLTIENPVFVWLHYSNKQEFECGALSNTQKLQVVKQENRAHFIKDKHF